MNPKTKAKTIDDCQLPAYRYNGMLVAFGTTLTGTTIHLHVDNVDDLGQRAVEAGATMVMEPADQSHGERQCRIRDPFGHEWLLGHEIKPAV